MNKYLDICLVSDMVVWLHRPSNFWWEKCLTYDSAGQS